MAQLIKEAKRFQQLAGIITEDINDIEVNKWINMYGNYDSSNPLIIYFNDGKGKDIAVPCVFEWIKDLKVQDGKTTVELNLDITEELKKAIGDENTLKYYTKLNYQGWPLEYDSAGDSWKFVKAPEFLAKQGFFSSLVGKKENTLKPIAINKTLSNSLKQLAKIINPSSTSADLTGLGIK